MKFRNINAVALTVAISCSGAAMAQIPGMPGGASKALGMPDVSSILPGNAAGVLEYCVKNEILGGTEAASILDGVMGKPEITGSDDFAAGAAGTLLTGKPAEAAKPATPSLPGSSTTGGKSSFSLESLPEPVRSKVCDAALGQAKSLL